MKRSVIAVTVVLLVLLFILPLVTIAPVKEEAAEVKAASVSAPEPETEDAPLAVLTSDSEQTIRVLMDDDTVQEMLLSDYLVGVVRAELPASFHQNTLCAQAVASRTYALYEMVNGGKHGDSIDVCTDPGCCQAYITEDTAREQYWGDWNAEEYEQKMEDAVSSTDGQVILYDSQPIMAVFHSSSAKQTRRAGDVWLYDLPYLQAVSSPETGDSVPNYYSRKEFTADEFRYQVLSAIPQADLSGEMSGWLSNVETDSGGNVVRLTVGGVSVKGTVLRSALGLRSACFSWEIQDGKFIFYVTGYGHGVGLSQYGANQMAEDGSTWQEILLHYYTGVTIGPYELPEN